MDVTREQVLNDPVLFERMFREWQILREAVRQSPIHFAVYDEQDRLIAWNLGYEGNHPEAFSERRAEAEAGHLHYRDLMRYQVALSVPADKVEAELDRLVALQRQSTGEPVTRCYPSVGHVKVYKYRLNSGATAGLATNINDLVAQQEDLEAARQQAEDTARRLERAHAEIEKIAYHDSMTGLPNRYRLQQSLQDLRNDPARQDAPCVVLHIDLDRFKQVNDTLGHAAGDHVLVKVATILQGLCRSSDMAVRLGGDEFVVVMVGNCDEAAGCALAERIVATVSEPIYYNASPCRIGASIGVSEMTVAEADLDAILSRADLAMYRAKERGRGRVERFDDDLKRAIAAKSRLADDLLVAIDEQQFVPVYQPQFSCRDGRLWGVETLCRWDHPSGTELSPPDFMKVATDMSLLGAIDRCLFSKVAQDLDWLQERGLVLPKVSLNVGYERLTDVTLAGDLASLKRPGLTISVELLETLSMDNRDDAFSTALDALREAGIDIEIDDFGSNRASVTSLIAVSPTAMKIDQAIMLPGPGSPRMQRLIKAIVDIGTALDIPVVAEGVETAEHVALARTLGCDVVQGFALARPMRRDALLHHVLASAPRVRAL